jgi:glycosyltransferase involved in cell wall biosynthesis
LKIALVAPYFPPMVGGIETYIFKLAEELSENNTVYVFTCGRGTTETYHDIVIFRLRALDVMNLPLHIGIPYPIPASLVLKLSKYDADIIHAHGHAFITSFQAALAAKLTKKPLVLTVHDVGVAYQDYAMIRGVRPIVDSTLVQFIIKQSTAVITLNQTTYDYISEFKPKRVELIPQGIDLEEFKPSETSGEYIAFIAARLTKQKGGEVFIRSIPSILKENNEERFMVIGDGVQRPYLEKLCKKLDIEKHVVFVGRVPHNQVPEYLQKSKIVVFPSEIPTGLSLLEIAASRKPIVTTANPWAQETLGDTPVYIRGRSPSDVAKTINSLLNDPSELPKIAERIHLRVSTIFSWKTVGTKHLRLYSDLIA